MTTPANSEATFQQGAVYDYLRDFVIPEAVSAKQPITHQQTLIWAQAIASECNRVIRDQIKEQLQIALAAAASYGATESEAANDRVEESSRKIAAILGIT